MSSQLYPTPTSPLYPLAIAFMRTGETKDFAALEAMLAPDHTHQAWPTSLRPPDHNARATKEGYLTQAKQMIGTVFESIDYGLNHPVNVVEGQDAFVLQLDVQVKLKTGRTVNVDHLYIIRFNAEQKIVSTDMWLDSAAAKAAFADTAFPEVGKDGAVTNLDKVVGDV